MLTRLNTWLQPINERFELQVSQQIPKVIIFFINLFDPNDVNAPKMSKDFLKNKNKKNLQTWLIMFAPISFTKEMFMTT